MTLFRYMLFVFLLGCQQQVAGAVAGGSTSDVDPLSLLTQEITTLSDAVGGGTVISLLSVGFAALLLLLLFFRLANRLRKRRGLNAPEVGTVLLLLGAAFVGVVLVALFYVLFSTLPLVAIAAAAAGAAGLCFVLFAQLPAWFTGFILALQRKVQEGDVIQLGQTTGVVQKIGLLQVVLVDTEGARVHLGLQALGKGPVAVSSPTHAHLVEFVYRHSGTVSAQTVDRLRTAAVLSPFRIVTSKVIVHTSAEDRREARLRFYTWSDESKEQALQHMKRMFPDAKSADNAP